MFKVQNCSKFKIFKDQPDGHDPEPLTLTHLTQTLKYQEIRNGRNHSN